MDVRDSASTGVAFADVVGGVGIFAASVAGDDLGTGYNLASPVRLDDRGDLRPKHSCAVVGPQL